MARFFEDLARAVALFQPKPKPAYFPRKTIAGDYDKLFALARKGEPETESDAARAIYGEEGRKALGRYFTLKSRLKDRLEQSVFFFSPESALSEREARYYRLWKRRLTVWALWKSGAVESAAREWEKIAEEAELYGWNDVCVEAYARLRLARGARQGSAVLWKKYDDALAAALRRQSEELRVEGALAEIELVKNRETLLGNENVEKCRAGYELAERLAREEPLRYGAQALFAKAGYLLAEARGDFTEALRLTESARDCLRRTKGGLDSETAAEFDAAALSYALLTRNIESCQAVAARRLESLAPAPEPVPLALDYWFLTALAAARYEDVAAVVRFVFARRSALERSPARRERWKLYEAYARLILTDEELAALPSLFQPRFSFRAILSAPSETPSDAPTDAPTNAPEKAAASLRLAYGFLRLTLVVEKRDFVAALSVIQELEPLRERYLRKDAPDYRAQCFLRMTIAAAAAQFDAAETRKKTESYCRRLAEARAFDRVKTLSPEVAPFERMWEFLLASFQDKTSLPAPSLRNALRSLS